MSGGGALFTCVGRCEDEVLVERGELRDGAPESPYVIVDICPKGALSMETCPCLLTTPWSRFLNSLHQFYARNTFSFQFKLRKPSRVCHLRTLEVWIASLTVRPRCRASEKTKFVWLNGKTALSLGFGPPAAYL